LYFTHFLCPGYSSFNAPATRELYPLSLHDALPILPMVLDVAGVAGIGTTRIRRRATAILAGQHATPQRSPRQQPDPVTPGRGHEDRKSTRLNSSHVKISYAVFCLKKKKQIDHRSTM